MIYAWRGVVRAAWRAGAIAWDVQLRTLAELQPVRGGRVTRGRSLTWGQVEKLLEAARGPEERALLATLAGCGLRRSEAASLTWDRYTRHDRDHFLRVLGKGNKERRLRVPNWAASALNSWRARCPERPGIFRWDEAAVYPVVAKTAERAGLGLVAPHDLRRTYYSLCRGAGLDVRDIQRAMGHASILTTAKYDRRPEEEALAALSKLDTPGGD
jgi:integrase